MEVKKTEPSPKMYTIKVAANKEKTKDKTTKAAPVSKKPSVDKFDDESEDDGLEELEFPTDLPLPEPESPPGSALYKVNKSLTKLAILYDQKDRVTLKFDVETRIEN